MTTELEAIQPDVSIGENLEPIEVVELEEDKNDVTLSPRDLKMKEITDRRNSEYIDNSGEVETFNQNLGEKDYDDLDPDPEPKPKEQAADSPFYQNDDGEMVMKLKVNGVESERTLEQLVSSHQKNESGDQKLQAAHDRQVLLDERERQQNERDKVALEQQSSQPSEQDAGEEDRKQLLKDAAQDLFDGDAEAYADKMEKLDGGRQQPTQNSREIIDQAKSELNQERVEEEQQAKATRFEDSRQGGIKWLSENYPDVDDSKRLTQLVDAETTVIINAGTDLSPMEVIKKATETVVKRAGLQEEPTIQSSDRSNNKTNMRPPPIRQKSSTYVQPVTEEVDSSPQAVIARMRTKKNAIAGR